jgi:tRNA pseudouridine38-40 synthase
VAALVAYDGAGYHGFQVQAGVSTVQGALEQALAAFTTLEGRVAGAGRTDTGVHAAGQVVAATVAWGGSPVGALPKLQDAWNAHLPRTIAVRRLVAAPPEFHPRFSAMWRTYRYTVVEAGGDTLGKSPLTDRYALSVPRRLDVEAMNVAAQTLVGEFDFAAFGQPTQGESTVRIVRAADWHVVATSLPELGEPRGRRLVLTITANGFLRTMVRYLVGSLLAVGDGRWTPADLAAVRSSLDRRRTAPPAPPHGLVLEQVVYPDHLDPWRTGE